MRFSTLTQSAQFSPDGLQTENSLHLWLCSYQVK